MKTKFARLKSSFMLMIMGMMLVVAGPTWAETTTFEVEQAKLVSKFAKHIRWPVDARQTKFIIAVYDDEEKYQYFSEFFANKGVNGKDIVVRSVDRLSRAKDVNILYLSEKQVNSLTAANNALTRTNVLIITENSTELHKTMIDISSNPEKTSIMFRINDPRITATQLMIPELSYFLDYKNNEKVLTASPTAQKKSAQSQQLSSLQKQLAQRDAKIKRLNQQLSSSKKLSAKYKLSLQKESNRLKSAQADTAAKQKELETQEKKLKWVTKQLNAQKKLSNGNSADNDLMLELEASVEKLTAEVAKQKALADKAAKNLAAMTKAQKTQPSDDGILLYVFIFLSIVASAIAFLMWKKANDVVAQPAAEPKPAPKPAAPTNDLLPKRNQQLIKSENTAAFGYIATDITYAVGLSLEELQTQLTTAGDTNNIDTLKPVVSLLDTFNLIAADQDDTDSQSFDVIAYVQKMMMLYNFEFEQSDISYDYTGETALKITSVPSYIALVLLHVINNSLKHGFNNDGNGKVSLNVVRAPKGGAIITYSDDGKGMDKSTLGKVFEPFFTTRTDRGYVGIGMSTSYDLIKNKLNGDINVESEEGKGTKVIITLP